MLLAMLWTTPAFAAHPLITDDTGTQGKGNFQLELNSEWSEDREKDSGTTIKETGGEIAAALSWGVADNIDLVAGLPWQCYTISEEETVVADEEGIGDMTIEVKWRFFESEESGLSFALKPGISIPAGDEQKGLGSGRISGSLMLIATHEGQLGALHGNIGYSRNAYKLEEDDAASRHHIWHASLAAELNMTEHLRPVANIGIETNEDNASDVHPVFLIGGLICSVNENLDLDFGVKGALNEAETDTTFLAGMAVRF